MEETSVLYGVESEYAFIEEKKYEIIKNISNNLTKIRNFESSIATIVESSG